CAIFRPGEVTEWPKVPDSKSGVPQGTVGSTPTLSARIFAAAIAAALVLAAPGARGNDADEELGEAPPEEPAPADPSAPAELGFDGPYAIELGVVLGIGGRLDDPPLYPA